MREVEIHVSPSSLADAAVRHFITLASQSVSDHGFFSTALSGGSTPRAMYSLLSRAPYTGQLDWSTVHLFWCDERCVPPDHSESNYGMVRRTLLEPISMPEENVHRIRGELEPSVGAETYERNLQEFFLERGCSHFDLILLGLGEDGHTASLFPESAVLHERERWVAPVAHSMPPPPLVDRVTLTPPVFNAAANVIFLVTGKNKADCVAEVWKSVV